MKQRTLLFVLVCLSAFTASAQVTVDDINYNLNYETGQAEVSWAWYGKYTGSVTIPATIEYDDITFSVASIGYSAFSGCSDLTSVTIPNSVTKIDEYAFVDCKSLTSIEIPNSVTEIGYTAFSGCTGLTSVTIGNSVTTIGDKAFCGCSGLTSIAIPSSVTRIGNAFYEGCINLKKVELNSNAIVSKTYNTTTSNDFSIKNMFGTQVSEYILGDSVKAIGEKSFQYCTDLTSVTIPNSVTEIGDWAFGWCSNLTSVTLGNSITSIGYNAFYWCSGLTSVHITDIAAWCKIRFGEGSSNERYSNPLFYAKHLFMDGKEITDLIIPDSVARIGNYVFYGWSNLTSVTIGKSVTEIGNNAFAECSSLTKVILNSNNIASQSFTSSSIQTFFGTQVSEYILGDSVKAIGEYAFRSCSNLKSITIPSSVTEIGTDAFRRCSGLTSVICKATSVPSTPSNAFYSVPQSSATLYVPASALEDYKATSPWSGFGSIVAIGEEPVVEGIAINETNFPDENFRNWILSQEYGQDGVLTDEEIAEVTYIGVSYQNISNLKGIEYFTALKNLYVSSGILTSLDVSKNTALEYLDCSCNMITLLDLSQNKALKNLSCWGNALTSLDVSECTALQSIDCKYNLLTSLDVSGCTALRKLDCEHNQLTSLDVSNKTELFWLMCYNNQLTSLDVSGCPNFLTLSFYCNQIKGAAMDKLVEDLPAVDFENWMGVIYSENEGNVMTTTQVAAARAKNWIPRYAINENDGRDYEGSEPEVKKCATPTISFVGGKIVFDCETEGVEFVSEVTCSDSGKYNSGEIPVTSTYIVTVYAKKEGYEDSDVATKEITVGGGSTAKKGDVNEDGTVNGTDIQEVINIIVNAE